MVFAVFSLFGKLAGCGGDGYFSCISGEAMPPEKKKKEVNSMTMVKRDSNSIWSLVREDRDIDDLIFAGETLNGREMSQPCSDR